MKLFLVSDTVLWNPTTKTILPGVEDGIRALKAAGNHIFLTSSHPEHSWLKNRFPDVQYQYADFRHRMTGGIVRELVELNKLKPSDVVVLGTKKNDMLMATSSKTLLVRCLWSPNLEPEMKKYGLPLPDPTKLAQLSSLLKDDAPWYFKSTSPTRPVYALTDAGTIGETDATVKALKDKLKACLKNNALSLRDEFTAHFMSSLCVTDDFRQVDVWGWYPSSKANNESHEVMKIFCTLARTTFGLTTRGPLFIRHQDTAKRTYMKTGRTDPTSEFASLKINPVYDGKLAGKTVAVIDDFLTHGLSFGVSSHLLTQAGAKKVICVAMGKFGNTAKVYEFGKSIPYQPMSGTASTAAQKEFVDKFRALL